MGKDASKVSIIILNWNGLKDTIECLESLKKIAYSNYEVIVVDNGSEGNDADVLEERYKDYIRVIRNKENLGFAEGNNVAIKEVVEDENVDYILTLNNDVKIEPNFLDELIKIANESESKIGMFQPKMLKYYNPQIIDSTGHQKWLGIVRDRGKGQRDRGQFDKKRNIFGVCAGAALYKKEMLQEIGLFDGNFFAVFEDVDLDFRAKKAGWRVIFVPKSIIFHKKGATLSKESKKFQEIGAQNEYIVVRRYYSLLDKIFVSFRWIFEILINIFKVFLDWIHQKISFLEKKLLK